MRNTTLAILCGGQSARMGQDKGLVSPLGDESLIARAIRLWASDFAETLVITHDQTQSSVYREHLREHVDPNSPVTIVCDQDGSPGEPARRSALTGVRTALLRAKMPSVVVVPVDQLGVRSLHIERLMRETCDNEQPAIGFCTESGEALPFPSIWSTAVLERINTKVADGQLSVRQALVDLGAELIGPDDKVDYTKELAFNGNTPEDLRSYFGSPLFDPNQRRLHYLRFSLTEACNMACRYCLPDGFPEWYRHKARLESQTITTILSGFRQLGFRKVRFTGGEPTVHPACLESVRTARVLGYESIALTTNGLRLKDLDDWLQAGLTQLNVSIDSLNPRTFFEITKSRDLATVLDVIDRALERQVQVKINTVLLRSVNGSSTEIAAMIDWALKRRLTLRFIELMQTGLNSPFASSERILGTEIEPFLRARGLVPVGPDNGAPNILGPASDFYHPEHPGRIGLINPMSCNFCSKCNRLRITAKGNLKLCLFGDHDLPVDTSSPSAVALNVRRLIDRKPERHYLDEGKYGNVATFRTIGG